MPFGAVFASLLLGPGRVVLAVIGPQRRVGARRGLAGSRWA